MCQYLNFTHTSLIKTTVLLNITLTQLITQHHVRPSKNKGLFPCWSILIYACSFITYITIEVRVWVRVSLHDQTIVCASTEILPKIITRRSSSFLNFRGFFLFSRTSSYIWTFLIFWGFKPPIKYLRAPNKKFKNSKLLTTFIYKYNTLVNKSC